VSKTASVAGQQDPTQADQAVDGLSGRREPRKFDAALYEARHLIENFFFWAKQFRAIATRHDKTASTFPAAVLMVAVLYWLN
jgi:transposase